MSFLNDLTAKLPFGKNQTQPEYYFALVIGLSEITASVWTLFNNEVEILNQSTISYQGNDELLDKSYQALENSLGVLEVEPKKVLFGVPDSWNIDDNLKEPYLKLLRGILKETDLEALAYVANTNAISFMLQKQEGVPPTAILLGLGEFVEVTLVRGGKVAGTRTTTRGEHLFEDIEKTLSQFTEVEVLPSKILIYPTKEEMDLNKLKDDLMSYPWMSKLSFLHFPKIEILEENIITTSLVLAGASELSPNIDLKHSFFAGKNKHQVSGVTRTLVQEEERPAKHIGKQEPFETGFVKGDIKEARTGPSLQRLTPKKPILEEEILEEDLRDDNLVSPDLPGESDEIEEMEDFSETEVPRRSLSRHQLDETEEVINHQEKPGFSLRKILHRIKSMLHFPFKTNVHKRLPLGKLLIIPAVIVVLVLAYLFLVKATVTIFVEPRISENVTDVIADPKATALDEVKKIIPGKITEVTVTGSGKDVASGTKQIGDPAKGKVVIYNLTDGSVSFSQGATLTATGGKKFTLDTSVQIASQSSSIGANYQKVETPGKTDPLGITAVAIGPESNLPAGTEMLIGNYSKSQVIGRVEEALAGGTSKNVTVITADDQKKLKAKVTDELKTKVGEEIQKKLSDDSKIVTEAISVVDGKYTFNKDVNDVASEFSLQATIRFKGTSYNDGDLRTIVSKLVQTNIPEGFEMNLQDAQTQADIAKVDKDGTLTFKAKFIAKLLPKYDTEKLKNEIKGATVNGAIAKIQSLENAVGSEIKFSPSVPVQFAILPFLPQNITILVAPK
ncbi:MAG: hypothetical protein Q7R97_00080 [Candidatus Daviesbacteria bacterium]|nr:hypothetical protein [Candidatus Daviesbacteria bacterium]